MAETTVLFVGVRLDQIDALSLPGFEIVQTDDTVKALEIVALMPPAMIVANHRIGELDGLEFFSQVMLTNPESISPVVFLAPEGSGVQPFVYMRQRIGLRVRYLDAAGELHTHIVREPQRAKEYTVKSLSSERLSDELLALLRGEDHPAAQATDNDGGDVLLIGLNTDVVVADISYHIQTEVIEVDPVTASCTVFSGGRAVVSDQERIKGERLAFSEVRSAVEAIHAAMLSRVHAGDVA